MSSLLEPAYAALSCPRTHLGVSQALRDVQRAVLLLQLWALSSRSGPRLCKACWRLGLHPAVPQTPRWQLTVFRAYPYNWEIYIEDLEYNTAAA